MISDHVASCITREYLSFLHKPLKAERTMLLSHIVSKRYSREYENIATDALAYILDTSEVARLAFMNTLRRVEPSLPSLQFKAQESDGDARPDLWGLSDATPHVFVENKFWAGLTDNQPVSYLERLANAGAPSPILAFVVPVEREETIWSEITRRITEAGIDLNDAQLSQGLRFAATSRGPRLLLMSWRTVLGALDAALVSEPKALADLHQLRALCDAADDDAIRPISSQVMSDQDIPRLISSLSVVVQDAVERAVALGAMKTSGLKSQADWQRIGRYIRFSRHGIAWIGTHFPLWRRHGMPLWFVFYPETHGERAAFEALRSWANDRNAPHAQDDYGRLCMGLPLPGGVEKESVVAALTALIVEASATLRSHTDTAPSVAPTVRVSGT